jgi:type I restriction enzyme R subunit
MDALMDGDIAHRSMSAQALNSEKLRDELLDLLLGPARFYDELRRAAMR